MANENPYSRSTNAPVYSLLSAVVLILGTLGFVIFGDLDANNTPIALTLVGVVVTTIPTLIAAAFSERASRDIRNGVMEQKVTQGAKKALDESGVTAAVEAGNNINPVAIAALATLVEDVSKRQQGSAE